MNKTKTIVLLVTLTFELILASTNFVGSAVAQTETKAVLVIVVPAMNSATTMGSTANS
jgi:hypothetical protein